MSTMNNDCVNLGATVHDRVTAGHGKCNLHACAVHKFCMPCDEGAKIGDTAIAVCGIGTERQCSDYKERPHAKFDRVVCLNLERRPDRLAQFNSEIAVSWPFQQPEIVKAIDGRRVRQPRGFTNGDSTWACFQSHRRIIEDAVNDGLDSILVFEDDALLCDDFAGAVEKFFNDVPTDWEMVFLGGWWNRGEAPTEIKPGIIKLNSVGSTVCYSARGEGLMKLYQYWHQWHNAHCDWAIGDPQPNTPRRPGTPAPKPAWIKSQKCYAPNPPLVEQASGWSDIRHRDHSYGLDVVRTRPRPARLNNPDAPVVAAKPELVGEKLKELLKEVFGVDEPSCDACRQMRERMNQYGANGCEQHRQEIVRYLDSQFTRQGNWQKAAMMLRGGTAGYFSTNQLLNEAIRRARG